ncbi:MAG: hypothetical protein L3J65_00180 [Robiginitomaculum sp.]|nr:hypothetical protein [Robiginitomaculum sp.]
MIIWIRNIVVIFALLSIVYVVLSVKARWAQKAKLDAEYTAPDKSRDITQSKEEYIATGMKKYGKSYRPKLIFGVYLVPIAIIAVLIYLAQYS